MVERPRIEQARLVARIRQGAAHGYIVGDAFAVASGLNARSCERIEFRGARRGGDTRSIGTQRA